ncbi:MAG: hypothetical protein COT73_10775 [Bdellovibrio sp. CG10_big_fil_rev_8_21_14_0_10_47_8]|nr:MAG: hypothetical protein COT73_10775 [Bdellovibrio sp. CG10_big_fil_rev_8_21_14_0_10_47_8]
MIGYLAPESLEKDLEQEIQRHPQLELKHQIARLFLAEGPIADLAFCQNIWCEPQKFTIDSISQTAKKLREHGKLWAPLSQGFHRRMTLIQEQLPKLKSQPLTFPGSWPERELGAWTLEDANTLWLSPKTSSPFANGEVCFVENREAPSRAYLKLWEFFSAQKICPQPSELCLDLGSSPGGWTWVLAGLGCKVISVDKAPLTPALAKNPLIQSLKKDAFQLDPKSVGPVDWLFSDIICYPERLLELVHTWIEADLARNFVCTIKFQGATDFEALDKFRKIPGSRIQHLFCNKHELTWSLIRPRN